MILQTIMLGVTGFLACAILVAAIVLTFVEEGASRRAASPGTPATPPPPQPPHAPPVPPPGDPRGVPAPGSPGPPGLAPWPPMPQPPESSPHGPGPIYATSSETPTERRGRIYLNVLLYVGALLIVAAAGSFVLLSLPALVKSAFLWSATLVFVIAGLLLFRLVRRLSPVGIAFTGTGLAVLPFAGIGVGAWDVASPSLAWLLTSLAGLVLYFVSAVLLDSRIISWLTVAYLFSLALSGASVASAPVLWHLVALVLASTVLRLVAAFTRGRLARLFATAGASLGLAVPAALIPVAMLAGIGTGGIGIVMTVLTAHFLLSWLLDRSRVPLAFARLAGTLAVLFALRWFTVDVSSAWFSGESAGLADGLVHGLGTLALGLVHVALVLVVRLRRTSELLWLGFGLALIAVASFAFLVEQAWNEEPLLLVVLAAATWLVFGAVSALVSRLLALPWFFVGLSLGIAMAALTGGTNAPDGWRGAVTATVFTVAYALFAAASLLARARPMAPRAFAIASGVVASIAVAAAGEPGVVLAIIAGASLGAFMLAAVLLSRDPLLLGPWAPWAVIAVPPAVGMWLAQGTSLSYDARVLFRESPPVALVSLALVLLLFLPPRAARAANVPRPVRDDARGWQPPSRVPLGTVASLRSLAPGESALMAILGVLLLGLLLAMGWHLLEAARMGLVRWGLVIPIVAVGLAAWHLERRGDTVMKTVVAWAAFGLLAVGLAVQGAGVDFGDSAAPTLSAPFAFLAVGILMGFTLTRRYAVLPVLFGVWFFATSLMPLLTDDDSLAGLLRGWLVWLVAFAVYWIARLRAPARADRRGVTIVFPTSGTLMCFVLAAVALAHASYFAITLDTEVAWLNSLPRAIGGFNLTAVALMVGMLGIGTGKDRRTNLVFLEPASYVAALGLALFLSGLFPISWVILVHVVVAPAFAMAWFVRRSGVGAAQARWIPAMAVLTIVVGIIALITDGWESLVFLLDHAALLVVGALRTRPEALWWGLAGVVAAVIFALRELLWLALLIVGLLIIGIVVWQLLRPARPRPAQPGPSQPTPSTPPPFAPGPFAPGPFASGPGGHAPATPDRAGAYPQGRATVAPHRGATPPPPSQVPAPPATPPVASPVAPPVPGGGAGFMPPPR